MSAIEKQGLKETVVFADQLMYTGFHYATMAGISFGVDDMIVPHEKQVVLSAAEEEIREIENQYAEGLVTSGEKYNKSGGYMVLTPTKKNRNRT